jgi:hypothetical protein
MSSRGAAQQALAADSPVSGFLAECVGEQLKRGVRQLLE